MREHTELFIGENIANRWQRAFENATNEIIVFSPYITPGTATDALLRARATGPCRIYTLFDKDVFSSGASSIGTLQRLKASGIRLYRLDNLHAKIVVIPNEFASIGSQNLTRGGERSHEATVVTTDRKTVTQIFNATSTMRKAGSQLRAEQLQSMLREVRKGWDPWKQFTQSLNSVAARIAQPKKWYYPDYVTLLAEPHADLTSWRFDDGSQVVLDPTKFYTCISEDRGRVGFVRVMRTRFSFVGKSKRVYLHTGETTARIWFLAKWPQSRMAKSNLRCTLWCYPFTMELPALFTIGNHLTLLDPVIKTSIPRRKPRDSRRDKDEGLIWFRDNRADIEQSLVEALLQPFVDETPYTNRNAREFFGKMGTVCSIRAVKLAGYPVLVAKKRSPIS